MRRSIRTLLLSLVLAACGSKAPAPAPATATASATATAAAPATAPATATATAPVPDPALVARAAQLPFRWYETVPAAGIPSFMGSVGVMGRYDDHIVGDEHTYEVMRDGAISCRVTDGAEQWRVQASAAFTGEPVIAAYAPREGGLAASAVIVSGPTATGWLTEAHARSDGALRWSTRGGGANGEVQLGVEGELVVVHQRGAAEDRLTVLAAETGALLHERPLDPAVTRLSRVHPASAVRARLGAPEGARLRRGSGSPMEVTLGRGAGEPEIRWTSHAFRTCHVTAIVEEGDDVVIADLCYGSSGVEVHGASRTTGTLRWSSHPYGIGPIGHSRWSNEVWLALDGPYVRVWGDESSLLYVSTLERVSGRELATITGR